MADVSKLKFENGSYNIKDSTARNEINNLDQKIDSEIINLGSKLVVVNTEIGKLKTDVEKATTVLIADPNKTDHTSDVQAVLNKGGSIRLIGEFKINDSNLNPVSNSKLDLSQAVLKKIATSEQNYYMLNIKGKENVEVIGGVIEGDLLNHLGTAGEWGHGINIINSKNVVVRDTVMSNFWGDGIYIGHEYYGNSTQHTENIFIENVFIDKASRNGISICGGKGITIKNPTIKNVTRTNPKAAIDIEPEGENPIPNYVDDVIIDGLVSVGCDYGIVFHFDEVNNKDINIKVTNTLIHDGLSGLFFIVGGDNKGFISVQNTVIRNMGLSGIYFGAWYDTGTPRIDIDGLEIDSFNTQKSTSEIYSSAITCYQEGIAKNIGNFSIRNFIIKRDIALGGNNRSIYFQVNGGGKFSNIELINPIELSGSSSNEREKVFFNTYDRIKIVDNYKVMKSISSYYQQSVGQWVFTQMEVDDGASDDVYFILSTMLDGLEVEFLNRSNVNMIFQLDTSQKFYPYDFQNIKVWQKGTRLKVKRIGNDFYVSDVQGNILQFT